MDVALIRRAALIEAKILFLNTFKDYFNELSDLKELRWINQEAPNVIEELKKRRLFGESALEYIREEFQIVVTNVLFIEKEISEGIEALRLFINKIPKLQKLPDWNTEPDNIDEKITLQDFEKIECDFKSIITENENRFSHLENYFHGEQWNEDGTVKKTILEVVAYLTPNSRDTVLNLLNVKAKALKGFTKKEGIWYEQLTSEEFSAKELLNNIRSHYEYEHERLLEAYQFCECGDINNAVSIYNSCTGVIKDTIHEVVANSIQVIRQHINTISKTDTVNKLKSKTNDALKTKNPFKFSATRKSLDVQIKKLQKELKTNLVTLEADDDTPLKNNSQKYIVDNLTTLRTLSDLLSKREKRLLRFSMLTIVLIVSVLFVSIFYGHKAWATYSNPLHRFEVGKSMMDWNGDKNSDANSKAFQHVKYAADQEYPPACLLASCMYAVGTGTEVNNYLAFYYAKKASDYDAPSGKYTLALMYDDGIFKNTHDDYMLSLYEEAAIKGDSKAVEKLNEKYDSIAESYLKGVNGCSVDPAKGFQLLKKSADLGNPNSNLKVADMYLNGVGVQKNHANAFKYYNKSHTLGNTNATYNLGICYMNGIGVDQDKNLAVQYLNESGKDLSTLPNYLETILSLGNDYIEKSSIVSSEKNILSDTQRKGIRLLNTAASLGNKQAQDILINQYIKDPVLLDGSNYNSFFDSWLFNPSTQQNPKVQYICAVKSLSDYEFGRFIVGWKQEKPLFNLVELAEKGFYKSHLVIGLIYLSQLKFTENHLDFELLKKSINFFITAYRHGISEASLPIVEIISHLNEYNAGLVTSYCKTNMPDSLFHAIELKLQNRIGIAENELGPNLIDQLSIKCVGCIFSQLDLKH
jgi:TPR repeat protein